MARLGGGFDDQFEEASETDVPERHGARFISTPKRADSELSVEFIQIIIRLDCKTIRSKQNS